MQPPKGIMHNSYISGYSEGYLEKHAAGPLAALSLLANVGLTGAFLYPALADPPSAKRDRAFQEKMMRYSEKLDRDKSKVLASGAISAGAGGLASGLWGKISNKPSLSRDLMISLLSGGAGAYLQDRANKSNTFS